jgi:steroid delta-isomerase-like uncharacterized protein
MAEQGTPSTSELARALFGAVTRHDLQAMAACWSDDIVEDFIAVGVFRGVDAVTGFFAEMFAAVPDFAVEALAVTAEGATAAVQWRATGRFTGAPFQGVHATGRPIELRGCDVMTFQDGLLAHNTIYYDGLAFARQIGLLPQVGSAADRVLQATFNAQTDLRARVSSRHH